MKKSIRGMNKNKKRLPGKRIIRHLRGIMKNDYQVILDANSKQIQLDKSQVNG